MKADWKHVHLRSVTPSYQSTGIFVETVSTLFSADVKRVHQIRQWWVIVRALGMVRDYRLKNVT